MRPRVGLLLAAALAPLWVAGCRCGLDASAIDDLRCSDLEPCPEHLECRDGYCQVPACGADGGETMLCGADCVDTDTDPLHCGRCDRACGTEQTCIAGGCTCVDATLLACGDECVRTSTDPANCGDCGRACPSSEVCLRGQCAGSCDEGQENCEGSCVDLSSDPLFCGDCDTACDAGQFCDSGACASCEGEADCDDRIDCTADRCEAGSCFHDVAGGRCLIGGTCHAPGDRNPDDACMACRPVTSSVSWSEDFDDGVPCTDDSCEAGQVSHRPRDEECEDGDVCAPCAGGCAGPPVLTLECDDSLAGVDGPDAECHLRVDGDFPAECFACSSLVGMTSLVLESFDGCDLAATGWTGSGSPICPLQAPLPPSAVPEPALEADDVGWSLTRRVNTTDFDHVRLCFDWADRGATGSEFLDVSIQTEGVSWTSVFRGEAGPVTDVDVTWFTKCIDLEPAAAGHPDLGLRFDAASSSSNKDVYLDQITVDAWVDDDLEELVLFSEDFAGCDLDEWQVDPPDEPTAPRCPVAQVGGAGKWLNDLEALQADNITFSVSRIVDASTICEDIVLSFDYGASRTDGNETFVLELDAGGGFGYEWGNEATTAAGAAPINQFATIVRNLSHRDSSVRFRSDVGIRFELVSDGNDRHMLLDSVEAKGKTCRPAGARVTVGDLLPAPGGDGYTFGVGSATQLTAYPFCTWDNRPAISARGRVVLLRR